MVEEQRISPVLCVPCAWWAAGPGLLISALGWSNSGAISYLTETQPSELQQDCSCWVGHPEWAGLESALESASQVGP